MFDPRSFGLYVIIDGAEPNYLDIATAAIAGGADVVQLRYKSGTDAEAARAAVVLRRLTRMAAKPFIVNDRLDLALAVGADGVHLGPCDLPVDMVRRVVGDRPFIIGASARTVESALAAQAAGADYLGVGPVFPTGSKADAFPVIGAAGIGRISAAVTIPIVAVGGITEANIREPLSAGAAGAAVISVLSRASNVESSARAIKGRVLQHYDGYRSASRR